MNADNTDLSRIFRGISGVESYNSFGILIEVQGGGVGE
jgi:hypothetical protein